MPACASRTRRRDAAARLSHRAYTRNGVCEGSETPRVRGVKTGPAQAEQHPSGGAPGRPPAHGRLWRSTVGGTQRDLPRVPGARSGVRWIVPRDRRDPRGFHRPGCEDGSENAITGALRSAPPESHGTPPPSACAPGPLRAFSVTGRALCDVCRLTAALKPGIHRDRAAVTETFSYTAGKETVRISRQNQAGSTRARGRGPTTDSACRVQVVSLAPHCHRDVPSSLGPAGRALCTLWRLFN